MAPKDPDKRYFIDNIRYNSETGLLSDIRGKILIGSKCNGYRYIWVFKRLIAQHRIAWLLMKGEWPINDIDHIDRVRDNNVWSNLRAATRSQNCENRIANKNNKSGIKGLRFRKEDGFWEPRLMKNGKAIYLGIYKDLEEAILARQFAEQEFFTHAP